MSETTSGALSGAASGAATGTAVMPGIGTAIGAGIGAIAGYIGGKKKKKAAKAEKKRQENIRRIASPEHLTELMATLQPMMREVVASGMGPSFQEAVAQSLAKHELTGTGVGEALRAGAVGAPAIFATQLSAEKASETQRTELAAENIAGPPPPEGGNPFLDAMLGGARGFISGGGSLKFKKPAAPGAPAAVGGGVATSAAGTPNLINEINPARQGN